MNDPLDNDLNTVLSYKEALAVHVALECAYGVEKAQLRVEALRGNGLIRKSPLLDKIDTAKQIMDVRRERAEEMGG